MYIQIGQTVKAETKAIQNIQEPAAKPYGNFNASVTLYSGFTAILIKNENYNHLINALSEADNWTGFPYSEKVFDHSTIIKN